MLDKSNLKLKLREINQPTFMNALAVLSNEKMPIKAGWNVQRIARQLKKEIQNGREAYINLLKKFSEVDEKGELIPAKSPEEKDKDGKVTKKSQVIPGTHTFVKDKDGVSSEPKFKKEFEQLLDIEIAIKSYPIDIEDLVEVKIEPAVLEVLSPLFNDDNIVKSNVTTL